jgi:hypothetical protein
MLGHRDLKSDGNRVVLLAIAVWGSPLEETGPSD